jgi:hypothetical protein
MESIKSDDYKNEIFDNKLFSDTTSINTFINNRETWKSIQSQIDEVNKTLNTLKEIKTIYDAKILELDDKINFHDNIFKYKLWSCEKYHEDRHIPVNDFLRLLDMGLIKNSIDGHEFISLKLTGGNNYFDDWISQLSSDDYYRIAKAVRLHKKFLHFDHLILSDIYEDDNKDDNKDHKDHNYLYLLEQIHWKHSMKYITEKRFDICRKTLLLLKEDGLLK